MARLTAPFFWGRSAAQGHQLLDSSQAVPGSSRLATRAVPPARQGSGGTWSLGRRSPACRVTGSGGSWGVGRSGRCAVGVQAGFWAAALVRPLLFGCQAMALRGWALRGWAGSTLLGAGRAGQTAAAASCPGRGAQWGGCTARREADAKPDTETETKTARSKQLRRALPARPRQLRTPRRSLRPVCGRALTCTGSMRRWWA